MAVCTCKLASQPGAVVTYDSSTCAVHGPDAPRYHVDHDTIHDRVSGKHVFTEEAAKRLNEVCDDEWTCRNILVRVLALPHGNGDSEIDQLCRDALAYLEQPPARSR